MKTYKLPLTGREVAEKLATLGVDHYLDTLGNRTDTTIRNLQEGTCEKTTLAFDSNTAVLTNKLSTEVYATGQDNLCALSAVGSIANHFNPLPAGLYAAYLYPYGTFTGNSTITITARYNKKSKNATDVDNRIMVVNKTITPKTVFTFEAPNGIDFISVNASNSGSYRLVIVRVNSLTEQVQAIDRKPVSTEKLNLMPFPFQYDYVKSGITSFDYNKDGFPCKGGLKFKHLANGAVEIVQAPDYNGKTSEAISFYLHNGTEVRLPKGTYTFGCRTYRNNNHVQDSISRLRVLARWDDGDSTACYPETLNNGEMGSAKPVGFNNPLTVNATHGINSITAFIYIPKDTVWPEDGLVYVPALISGDESKMIDALPSFFSAADTSFNRNIVYRYSNNLLISRSPKIYNNNVNGTGLGTPGTTKNGLPYAESNGVSITQVASGHYILNGTATADTEFQICPGYTFMDPIGTFKFGGIPSTVDSKVSLITRIRYLTSDNRYDSMSNVTATPGVDATITSTRDKRMCAYYNARIKIQAGAVCNNDLISWYIKPVETSTVDRYRMPVASAGDCPLFFDYYKESDSIYIANPNFNITVNALSKGTGIPSDMNLITVHSGGASSMTSELGEDGDIYLVTNE